MRKVFLLLIAAISLWSCGSYQWKEDRFQAGNNPLLFNEGELVGTGLKPVRSGYRPKFCLKNVRAGLSGGTMEVRFRRAEDFRRDADARLKSFLDDNFKRAGEFNILKYRMMPLLLEIAISGREATLDERKLAFRSDIKKLVKEGNLSGFYDRCGTEFIESVIFDSKIYFFLCLYFPAEKEKKITAEIEKYLTGVPGDIFQLSLLKGLSYRYPLYYSFLSNAGEVYVPEDFFYSDEKEKNLEKFFTGTVRAAITSSHGTVKRYRQRPWLSLPEAAGLGYQDKRVIPGETSPENIYQSIILLRESLRDYRILLRLKNDREGKGISCRNELVKEENVLSWENLKKCENQAWKMRNTDFAKLSACSPLVEGIGRLNRISHCRGTGKGGHAKKFISFKRNFSPVVLSAYPVAERPVLFYRYTGINYYDSKQYKKLPPRVIPGQLMAMPGRKVKPSCIDRKTLEYSNEGKSTVQMIKTNLFPGGIRKASLWRRIFLFWKKHPERILYRGSFEVEGYSSRLLSSFRLDKKSEDLARKDPVEFFKKFGTHYAAQVQTGRGMVYYYSMKSKKDKDIKIHPYGYSEKPVIPIKGMGKGIADLQKKSCLTRLLFWRSGKRENPLLKPPTVDAFFQKRKETLMLMKNDGAPVARKIYLEPWSEYLINNNIVSEKRILSAMDNYIK